MERIREFITNNNSVKAEIKDELLIINNCWNDDSFMFKFSNEEPLDYLNNIVFPNELFAIFHKDKNLYEFIYSPLREENIREFSYIFCSQSFKLYYAKPTEVFKSLVTHFSLNNLEESNDRTYGLLRFAQYYSYTDVDEQEKIFPTNFFIEGDFTNFPYEEHINLFRHVNFMLSYYDRKSPRILIYNLSEENLNDILVPCKNKNESFPERIMSNSFDPTLLELMEAARDTDSSRLKYIFYFQILEYSSYYYIENKLKRQITNIIKSPDILNTEKYSNRIIEIYSDYLKVGKDDMRMDKLLEDFCDFDDIKDELITNSKYFINNLCFDGGFSVKKLFNEEDEIKNFSQSTMQTIRRNITSIRNVLVHAREPRENSEIKPTKKNVQLLKPYLFLLRRIAETIVIKYS